MPVDETSNNVTLTGKDFLEWSLWKAKKDREDLQRGAWWLTPEGREKIEETWPYESYNDGNCVRPLYDALVSLEREHVALQMTYKQVLEGKEHLLHDFTQQFKRAEQLTDRCEELDRTIAGLKIQDQNLHTVAMMAATIYANLRTAHPPVTDQEKETLWRKSFLEASIGFKMHRKEP